MNFVEQLAENGCNVAINAHDRKLSYTQLSVEVIRIAQDLQNADIRRVGLYADNSAAWICLDLACMYANIVFVPIPLFFSAEQIRHLFDTAALDTLFTDRELPIGTTLLDNDEPSYDFIGSLRGFKLTAQSAFGVVSALNMEFQQRCALPNKTAKVTFTSGSTGKPKGVCLSAEHQMKVAQSLVSRVSVEQPVHLVVLPLSTLLENIAGVYAPLLAKGCLIVPNELQRGFNGSQLVDVPKFLQCISTSQANTLITVPELLKVMVAACNQGWQPPASFGFIAVGGAIVAKTLINSARALGLPVYQGYGLSECGSVVSLAGPLDPPESCGRPLEHAKCRRVNKVLYVTENIFLGYLGDPSSWYPTEVDTGDFIDFEQQCLFVKGRRKQQIINSMGRNISPEWAESLMLANPAIHQAFIVGEARPYCVAIISLHAKSMSKIQLSKYLIELNRQLPDYAKVRKFILLNEAMSQQQGLITSNGRVKRDLATAYFSQQIDLAYQLTGQDSQYPELEQLIEQEFINDTI